MKIKSLIKNQFTFSIQEIALAGIFTALWIISAKFLNINFGFMQAGITYVWAILIGLTTKPLLGFVVAVIADTISLAIGPYGITFWMWEYAIIYPAIVLFASGFKHVLKLKNKYVWWTMMIVVNLTAITVAIIYAINNGNFVYKAKSTNEAEFDFTKLAAKITIWVCVSIMIAMFALLVLLAIWKRKYATYLGIYTLVSIVIMVSIWIWGPIAQIRFNEKFYHSTTARDKYDLFLIGRIFKTPIILPLYTTIAGSGFFAYTQIQKHSSSNHKW